MLWRSKKGKRSWAHGTSGVRFKRNQNGLIQGKVLNEKETLDLIFVPVMGGKLTKEHKLVRALRISKDYPIDNKQDVQAMLYTFALKFLNSNELEQVKEVCKGYKVHT